MSFVGGFASGLSRGVSMSRRRDSYRHPEPLGVRPPADRQASMPAAPRPGELEYYIDRTEGAGRYDTLFGHAQRPGGSDGGRFDGVDVTSMTLDQLREFQSPSGEYGRWVAEQVGRVATPIGRYQIVGTTLRNTAQQLGLSGDTVFSPQVQQQMFRHLADQRLASADDMTGKIRALRQEWEGFRSVPDEDLATAIQNYEQRRRRGATGPAPLGAQPVM